MRNYRLSLLPGFGTREMKRELVATLTEAIDKILWSDMCAMCLDPSRICAILRIIVAALVEYASGKLAIWNVVTVQRTSLRWWASTFEWRCQRWPAFCYLKHLSCRSMLTACDVITTNPWKTINSSKPALESPGRPNKIIALYGP